MNIQQIDHAPVLTAEYEHELRAAINQCTEDVRGTMSYERKRLLGEIDRLRALCRDAYDALGWGGDGDSNHRTHSCVRCGKSMGGNGSLREKLAEVLRHG